LRECVYLTVKESGCQYGDGKDTSVPPYVLAVWECVAEL
jgi:hypothetical protein